ncbi:MAG TPA: hypothetical protein VMF70_06205, partial [Gemmatimonadales bacterium]|nr:hypothetical protein [Gemmatimonadales bacterium]
MGFRDKADAREKARRGGLARAAQRKTQRAGPPPFTGSPLDLMALAGMGASWDAWRALLRAIYHLPMSEQD